MIYKSACGSLPFLNMNIQLLNKEFILYFLFYFDESFMENQYYLHTKIINVIFINFLIWQIKKIIY